LIHEWTGIVAPAGTNPFIPVAGFTGATDMGFMGSVTSAPGDISAEFWLLEIDI